MCTGKLFTRVSTHRKACIISRPSLWQTCYFFYSFLVQTSNICHMTNACALDYILRLVQVTMNVTFCMFSQQYHRRHIANMKITSYSHEFNQLQCFCVLIIAVLARQLNQHLAQENIARICFMCSHWDATAARRHYINMNGFVRFASNKHLRPVFLGNNLRSSDTPSRGAPAQARGVRERKH